MASLLGGFSRQVRTLKSPTGFGVFYRLPADLVAAGRIEGLTIPKLQRYLVLDRSDLYWSRPAWGTTDLGRCRKGQVLLVERADGLITVLLPLIDGNLRATLRGSAKTLALEWEGLAPGEAAADATLLFAASGRDVHALMAEAVRAVRVQLDTFRLRAEKRMPAFCDTLGWCTWDAFYHTVDEKKVLRGLETFRQGGVQPGFVILDDGWLDAEGDHLNDFPPNRTKFPRGLAPLIAAAKAKYGIRHFGVWHAFQGYWAGLHPSGRLAQNYKTIHNKGCIRPWKPDEISDLYHVASEDVCRFYQDFHDYLRRQGADFVKVDGQSATEVFTAGVQGRVKTMAIWQKALQGSVQTHFEGNVIHCMANGSDVAYNLLSTSGWRNSDDYFPKRPESHGWHLLQNAMNSLWTSHFALPDWDMFWSGHPEGAFHAAARAISGGPIYVSDPPGRQDFAVLARLVTSDGRVLRSSRPALPAADCVFTNTLHEPALLKLTNRSGPAGVLGLFNCQRDGKSIAGTFSPSDVHDLPGERFVAYRHRAGTVELLRRSAHGSLELPPLGWEIVTLAPLLDGTLAVLGLLDKYNSAAAIACFARVTPKLYRVRLRDGGRLGVYLRRAPRRVTTNGRAARGRYDKRSGLLTLTPPAGAPVDLLIYLA